MAYHVSLLSGAVQVIPDAVAVEDVGASLQFLTARDPHTEVLADVPKAQIVGVESTLSDGAAVMVVDPDSEHAGERGIVTSLERANAVNVALDGGPIRHFLPEQLGVWSTNRLGDDGHPAAIIPPGVSR